MDRDPFPPQHLGLPFFIFVQLSQCRLISLLIEECRDGQGDWQSEIKDMRSALLVGINKMINGVH